MTRTCFFVLLGLMGWLLPVSWGAAEDVMLLSYRSSGGFSPYGQVTVGIAESGKTKVVVTRHSKKPLDYETDLSEVEMAELRKQVESSGFFTIPAEEQNLVTDTGETELTITLAERTRTLKFGHRKALEPIIITLWSLTQQAEAIHALETDGDVYVASGSVNLRSGGAKVLQPERLKAPLMAYIRKGTDRQKIEWAIQGLVWLITPEEYREFMAELMKQKGREELVFYATPSSGNVPETHSFALCPLYLEYAKALDARRGKLTHEESLRLEGYMNYLGEGRYEPALPFMMEIFARSDAPMSQSASPRWYRMGPAALRELAPFLESAKAGQRRDAIQTMIFAARGNPKSDYGGAYSPKVFAEMVTEFEKTLPRLEVMAREDASKEVREKAKEGVEELRKEMARK